MKNARKTQSGTLPEKKSIASITQRRNPDMLSRSQSLVAINQGGAPIRAASLVTLHETSYQR
jgi:hypothetical protein